MTLRRSLFRKYVVYFVALVSAALIVSGLVGLHFTYQENKAALLSLQQEKAVAAASRIETYVQDIERQLGWVRLWQVGRITPEQRRNEYRKLLRLAPAITDVMVVDAAGRERLRVSRLAMDATDGDADLSSDAGFLEARGGRTYFSPVYLRKETEPYMTIAVAGVGDKAEITVAELNLKFVWEVISRIKIGQKGLAYVVDSRGHLIAHPDITYVLQRQDLSALPQVKAARDRDEGERVTIARSSQGQEVLTAHAAITSLGWLVFVEQPLAEAFAPLYVSLERTGLLLVSGLVLSVVASLYFARRMIRPIKAIEAGAAQFAAGNLDERIAVDTGDELGALAAQFNTMAHKLRESYAGLEQKIEDRTRQLAEADRTKSRFLAAASHDLRQPVHALGLFVAQLQEARDPSSRDRIIEKVEASTSAVSHLVEALLDISKLDQGTVEPQIMDFALQPLLDRLEEAFSLTAQARDLRFRLRPTSLCVSTDPILLERILLNLAANAVRYTKEGGVVVGVRRRGTRARIEVWDTGVGIPPDEQRRIFEEFYQLGTAPDDGSKGLGLGLAIVDRLTRLLGVAVSVRSTPGAGSVFAIEVPIASGEATRLIPASPPRDAWRINGLSVLLIDDDTGARDAAEGLLAQWGCRVMSASSGKEAYALLSAGAAAPAVIISDYRLRGNELGTDVVQAVRARFGVEIPAVIVSADSSAASYQAIVAARLHVLRKPLKAAQLRALLHHVVVSAHSDPEIAALP
jgi:signal transduction histidine kinase/ActR/RegA family two-component response regulator